MMCQFVTKLFSFVNKNVIKSVFVKEVTNMNGSSIIRVVNYDKIKKNKLR